jgi:hypothetical protein
MNDKPRRIKPVEDAEARRERDAIQNEPPSPLVDEVARVVALGASEDVAREAVATARRERLAARNIVMGGCLALADAMPDVSYVMSPVLVQRQVLTLTGRAGHGKSTVAIAIAFALALDRELGPLKPLRRGLVYFISAEDTDGTRKRIYAEAIRHNLNPEERAAIDTRLRWVHVNVTMNPALIAEYLRDDARAQSISAVFVDTGLALFAGDDENANQQMQAFAVSCRVLTELDGAPCVLVFWHPVKNANADNLIPRGGSALLNAIDGNLTLWLDADTDTATLAHTSKWRADLFEPIDFTLETVQLVMPSGAYASIRIATPKTGAQIEQRESEAASRRAALLLALDGTKGPQPVRDVAATLKTSTTTIHRELKDLAKSKPPLVELDAVTKHYRLTSAGRKAAAEISARAAAAYKAARDGE